MDAGVYRDMSLMADRNRAALAAQCHGAWRPRAAPVVRPHDPHMEIAIRAARAAIEARHEALG